LLALMFASLGSAYLRLGAFNVVAGLAIAGIKAALVLWLFMRLRDAPALMRFVARRRIRVVGGAARADRARLRDARSAAGRGAAAVALVPVPEAPLP
jgi:hypothetical protein